MIYHVTSGNIVPGKDKEAEPWLLKIAAYENNKFPNAKAQISRNINGANNRFYYTDTHASLADWESRTETLRSDSGWLALLEQWEGLIVPGSVENNFYRVIA